MKKIYNSPELIVNQFESVDVVTLSTGTETGPTKGIYTTNGKTTYSQLS